MKPHQLLIPPPNTYFCSGCASASAGRTILLVTHRVSTLRDADRILMLDQGVILEDGSWDQLVSLGGAFATLAGQQQALHTSPPA